MRQGLDAKIVIQIQGSTPGDFDVVEVDDLNTSLYVFYECYGHFLRTRTSLFPSSSTRWPEAVVTLSEFGAFMFHLM